MAGVVSDADSSVFARRVAPRLEVEDEPDRDPARRVRTSGANTDSGEQEDGERNGWFMDKTAHGWCLFRFVWRLERKKRSGFAPVSTQRLQLERGRRRMSPGRGERRLPGGWPTEAGGKIRGNFTWD